MTLERSMRSDGGCAFFNTHWDVVHRLEHDSESRHERFRIGTNESKGSHDGSSRFEGLQFSKSLAQTQVASTAERKPGIAMGQHVSGCESIGSKSIRFVPVVGVSLHEVGADERPIAGFEGVLGHGDRRECLP